ncbi:Uncharacterised protein [Mycobacteroides abscessus subsp. massiliense]|nr:Uncharacterised protein [Mycobacteroides abscessus subsp. massiliense]SLI16944.1 Uncharacterised protein [Mycobacteroides abscessus subsp. massiliense]
MKATLKHAFTSQVVESLVISLIVFAASGFEDCGAYSEGNKFR